MDLLDNAVILGKVGGCGGGNQSILLEVPLGHVVDRNWNVSAAHLVDAELGPLDCGLIILLSDAALSLELVLVGVFFGDLLLFDDRLPNGDGFRAIGSRFSALGSFRYDHLGTLGDFGCRGGATAGSHFLGCLGRWFLKVRRFQNCIAITELGVVFFEY